MNYLYFVELTKGAASMLHKADKRWSIYASQGWQVVAYLCFAKLTKAGVFRLGQKIHLFRYR